MARVHPQEQPTPVQVWRRTSHRWSVPRRLPRRCRETLSDWYRAEARGSLQGFWISPCLPESEKGRVVRPEGDRSSQIWSRWYGSRLRKS